MKTLKSYDIDANGESVNVKIVSGEDFVKLYKTYISEISPATLALLDNVKENLLRDVKINVEEIFDPASIIRMKREFSDKALKLIEMKIPVTNQQTKKHLVSYLIREMLGLGKLEILIADNNLEEIVINTAKEPVWVFHKEFGWLKTNIKLDTEKQVNNYASIVARRVGRQITTLKPLLDAHLVTGDRVNATLFPISTKGNTLTIRKFARKPWTITDFIENKTITEEVAAFMWLCIQYELNMIIAGGTSSGKTALLNTLMPFIQPNHRIISIEDTRELSLPPFLHWIPLTTREPNPEGKGGVDMLKLMINSLRMRPDRMVVGEIRRANQAEVLFEAMHTGHSVYATLHAETVEQVLRRMTNPPINIPQVMMEALHLVVVQYRDRRKGIRRTYQVAELIPTGESEGNVVSKPNTLYRCKPNGEIVPHDESIRIFDTLSTNTGMSRRDIKKDIAEKISILKWMEKNSVKNVNSVGRIMAEYYAEPEKILKMVKETKNQVN